MEKEAERVYATVLPRIIRYPRKVPILALPFWLVCPDLPVPKHEKQSLWDVVVNNGLHCHGAVAIPPWNRINCGLDQHFELYQNLYVRRGFPLARVHAIPITHDPENVVGYNFKAIRRQLLDLDHVLVLPRCHSEMPAKPHQMRTARSQCPVTLKLTSSR